jgi:hypothetical protein
MIVVAIVVVAVVLMGKQKLVVMMMMLAVIRRIGHMGRIGMPQVKVIVGIKFVELILEMRIEYVARLVGIFLFGTYK